MFDLKDLKELPTAREIEAAGKLNPPKEDVIPLPLRMNEEPEPVKNS
jgi:hypothetical protein